MDGQKYEGAGVMWGTLRYSSIDVSSFVEEAMIIISVFRISMKRLKWLPCFGGISIKIMFWTQSERCNVSLESTKY
jgi:hypothetical protein